MNIVKPNRAHFITLGFALKLEASNHTHVTRMSEVMRIFIISIPNRVPLSTIFAALYHLPSQKKTHSPHHASSSMMNPALSGQSNYTKMCATSISVPNSFFLPVYMYPSSLLSFFLFFLYTCVQPNLNDDTTLNLEPCKRQCYLPCQSEST